MGRLGHAGQVDQRHGGVGRGFGIGQHGFGVLREGGFPVFHRWIGQPDGFDAVVGRDAFQEGIGGAVEGFLRDDGLPALHAGQDGGGNRRHAGSKHQPGHHFVDRPGRFGAQQVESLQRGEFLGQLGQVGVAHAGVHVARIFALEDRGAGGHIRKAEGGGLVNWGDMRVLRVMPFPNVIDERAQSLPGIEVAHLFLLRKIT